MSNEDRLDKIEIQIDQIALENFDLDIRLNKLEVGGKK